MFGALKSKFNKHPRLYIDQWFDIIYIRVQSLKDIGKLAKLLLQLLLKKTGLGCLGPSKFLQRRRCPTCKMSFRVDFLWQAFENIAAYSFRDHSFGYQSDSKLLWYSCALTSITFSGISDAFCRIPAVVPRRHPFLPIACYPFLPIACYVSWNQQMIWTAFLMAYAIWDGFIRAYTYCHGIRAFRLT